MISSRGNILFLNVWKQCTHTIVRRSFCTSVLNHSSRTAIADVDLEKTIKNDQGEDIAVNAAKNKKLSPEQEFRNRLVQAEETEMRDYLGVKLFPVEEVKPQYYVTNYISPDAPRSLSLEGKDLWTRFQSISQFIRCTSWELLCEYSPDHLDEYELANQHYQQVKDSLPQKDREILDPLIKRTNEIWRVALQAESMCTVLVRMYQKFKNQYQFPDENLQELVDLTQDFLDLRDKYWNDREIRDRLNESVFKRLNVLKEKIFTPELDEKFPYLFG